MSLQDVIQKNQPVIAVVAIVVLVFAVYSTMRTTGAVGGGPPRVYYYDLQSGDLFVDVKNQDAPIDAPSGGQGVLAHVYSCTDCGDEASRFVAYVEKLTDEAKAEAVKTEPDLQLLAEGRVISAVGDEMNWVMMDSPAGGHITGIAHNKCEQPQRCFP